MELVHDRDKLERGQPFAKRIYGEIEQEMIAYATMDFENPHGMHARRLILSDCRQIPSLEVITEVRNLLRQNARAVVRPREGDKKFPDGIVVQDYHDSGGYWHVDITSGSNLNDLYIGHKCYVFDPADFRSGNPYSGMSVATICEKLVAEKGAKPRTLKRIERIVLLTRILLDQNNDDDNILKQAPPELKRLIIAVGPPAHAVIEAMRAEYRSRNRANIMLV